MKDDTSRPVLKNIMDIEFKKYDQDGCLSLIAGIIQLACEDYYNYRLEERKDTRFKAPAVTLLDYHTAVRYFKSEEFKKHVSLLGLDSLTGQGVMDRIDATIDKKIKDTGGFTKELFREVMSVRR